MGLGAASAGKDSRGAAVSGTGTVTANGTVVVRAKSTGYCNNFGTFSRQLGCVSDAGGSTSRAIFLLTARLTFSVRCRCLRPLRSEKPDGGKVETKAARWVG